VTDKKKTYNCNPIVVDMCIFMKLLLCMALLARGCGTGRRERDGEGGNDAGDIELSR
jgi:hypothetical protein